MAINQPPRIEQLKKITILYRDGRNGPKEDLYQCFFDELEMKLKSKGINIADLEIIDDKAEIGQSKEIFLSNLTRCSGAYLHDLNALQLQTIRLHLLQNPNMIPNIVIAKQYALNDKLREEYQRLKVLGVRIVEKDMMFDFADVCNIVLGDKVSERKEIKYQRLLFRDRVSEDALSIVNFVFLESRRQGMNLTSESFVLETADQFDPMILNYYSAALLHDMSELDLQNLIEFLKANPDKIRNIIVYTTVSSTQGQRKNWIILKEMGVLTFMKPMTSHNLEIMARTMLGISTEKES